MLRPNCADFLIRRELAALGFSERGFDIGSLFRGEFIGRLLAPRKFQQHPRELVLHVVRQRRHRSYGLFEELRHNASVTHFEPARSHIAPIGPIGTRRGWGSGGLSRKGRKIPRFPLQIPPRPRLARPKPPSYIRARPRTSAEIRHLFIGSRAVRGGRDDRRIEPSLGQAASGPGGSAKRGCEQWLKLSASTLARPIRAWRSWKDRR